MLSTVMLGWGAVGLRGKRMPQELTMKAMSDASGINLACILQGERAKIEMLPQTAKKYAGCHKMPLEDALDSSYGSFFISKKVSVNFIRQPAYIIVKEVSEYSKGTR